MNAILFNGLGLLLILVIVYWFWLSKTSEKIVSADEVEIVVKNGIYSPSLIRAKQGKNLTLTFLREDHSPCSAVVLFPQFKQSRELPIGKPESVILDLNQKGEFVFHCEMNMYRGKLIVD